MMIHDEQPERGICTYSVWYQVNTNTSGNELRGREVFFGEYASQQRGWRSADGYTTAAISRVVYYDDYEVTNG